MEHPLPAGIVPVEPPDAPAALECVERVLADTCAALGVRIPPIRWFRSGRGPAGDSHMVLMGMYVFPAGIVWLNAAYRTPEALARTAAHEGVHHWQRTTRGDCVDDLEHEWREREAQHRARAIVPVGSIGMPRGKRRDAWYEQARRRTGTSEAKDNAAAQGGGSGVG
jgi:hypothetical protein